MSNKVAVVTGANKGLGLAIVKGLCKEFDGKVYLTSRDEGRGLAASMELEKQGYQPTYHQLDITDYKSISNFCEHLTEKQEKVDLLINNAGILFLKDATEPKLYQAEQTLRANFFATVNFTEVILPLMKNGGKILNISSSSGHLSRIPSEELRKKISEPDLILEELKKLMEDYVRAVKEGKDVEEGWSESCYVVSKVGINAYTFMLHRRLKDRSISVNCVHPGYVMSDMTRGAGSITPEEGARVPLQLALQDDRSGIYVWRQGTVVPWDGPDPRGYIDGQKV